MIRFQCKLFTHNELDWKRAKNLKVKKNPIILCVKKETNLQVYHFSTWRRNKSNAIIACEKPKV